MPKRSRQSHIPAQVRRRKPRRPNDFTSQLAESEAFHDLAEAEGAAVPLVPATATPRMGRRLSAATASREGTAHRATGQLPTFERAYLIRELTQIGIISGSLLMVIILLWLVMR